MQEAIHQARYAQMAIAKAMVSANLNIWHNKLVNEVSLEKYSKASILTWHRQVTLPPRNQPRHARDLYHRIPEVLAHHDYHVHKDLHATTHDVGL